MGNKDVLGRVSSFQSKLNMSVSQILGEGSDDIVVSSFIETKADPAPGTSTQPATSSASANQKLKAGKKTFLPEASAINVTEESDAADSNPSLDTESVEVLVKELMQNKTTANITGNGTANATNTTVDDEPDPLTPQVAIEMTAVNGRTAKNTVFEDIDKLTDGS